MSIGFGLADLAVLCEVGCCEWQFGWMREIGSSVVNYFTLGRCRKWSVGAQSLIPRLIERLRREFGSGLGIKWEQFSNLV